MAALVSQLERLTTDVERLVSRVDAKERPLGYADSLNQPSPAAPCSPNIIGDEVQLLDDDPPPPTMMTLSCHSNIRYDSMELIADDRNESVKYC